MPKKTKPGNNNVNLEDLAKQLENIEELIRENNQLARVIAHPILTNSLQTIFKTPKQLYAYELSNGERSTRDIGKLVKLDQKGISNWWRDWEKEGLVEKIGKKGQFKASYTLLELLVVYLPSSKQKNKK